MKNFVITRFRQRRALKTQLRPRTRWLQTFAAMLQHALIEPRQVEVTHQRIFLSKLPREFQGFRIVQISDVHHSPFLSEQEIAAAVQRANQLQADLVVLTGDYVSHSKDYIPGCARALSGLQAPHGVFAIMGNHDHWTDATAMESAFVEQGICVLTNENVRVELGDAFIQLLGVDDLGVGQDNLPSAMLDTSSDEVRILLCHNPRIIREAARAEIDLVLSGHTHGGQINWRLLTRREDGKTYRWLRRPSRRFTRGHTQLGATQLYVNRGLGTVIAPLRYGCPPEITLLELVKA